MDYDIIGDIHGHADALKTLLKEMGYRENKGAWRHPGRKAIFVGDFIDRGPKQVETVDIVRRMVEAGSALAVMGNHEFNAIAWFLPDPACAGEYLRPHFSPNHGEKNFRQHKVFLAEVSGTPLHKEIITWFLSLPLWLDLPGLRVVHACWHERFMDDLAPLLAPGKRLTEDLVMLASREPQNEVEKDNPRFSIFKAVEALTKGLEIPLPKAQTFTDKDGHQRDRVRVRWWDADAVSYRQAAMLDDEARSKLSDDPIPDHARMGHIGGAPLFFGHYWLTGEPKLQSNNVACVDYSIARGGNLVTYRWGGEPILVQSNFFWVGP